MKHRNNLMWKMTLKQRKRHGVLMAQIEDMRGNPHLFPPADYTPGENPEEDAKYEKVGKEFQALVEELHQLEEDVR